MRKHFAALALSCILFTLPQSTKAFTLTSFSNPYSVRVDSDTGDYYVTNQSTSSSGREGGGYVSKISSNGSIVFQKYIGAKEKDPLFTSPKGLALSSKRLFVADGDEIKIFDKSPIRFVRSIPLAGLGAKALSNLFFDRANNVLYASDPEVNRIFKINLNKNGSATTFAGSEKLGQPKGLLINARTKNLMFVAQASGTLYEIDAQKKLHALRRGLEAPEGLDYDNSGNIFISSVKSGEIYKIAQMGRGALSTFVSGLSAPADICYDRRKDELVIPSLKRNAVTTIYRRKI